jgi:putative endonuclease
MQNRVKGNLAEDRAVEFLERLGFEILERNFYAKRFGEIDIIAKKERTLHFVEVKSSRGGFEPAFNLTKRKLQKIINSTEYYLQSRELDLEFCISALIVRGREIEFLENITV